MSRENQLQPRIAGAPDAGSSERRLPASRAERTAGMSAPFASELCAVVHTRAIGVVVCLVLVLITGIGGF